jgi:hypothetical protein
LPKPLDTDAAVTAIAVDAGEDTSTILAAGNSINVSNQITTFCCMFINIMLRQCT